LNSAHAETAEQIIGLKKQGLGDEVLLAAVERSNGYTLSPDEIIKLKDAGVSEKVIAAMLRKASAPAAPAPAPAQGTPPPAQAPAQAAAEGTLNLENVDDKAWAFDFDPRSRTLTLSPATAETRQSLAAHGGVSLGLPAGAYAVRYQGNAGQSFNVRGGEKSLIILSRVDTADFEGLYVSIFEKGERKGGGQIGVLRQAQKIGQPQASYEYAPPRTEAPVVIQQAPVVVQAPPVVYTTPGPVYYSSPYYGYPRYYPYSYSPYYSRPYSGSLNFFYGNRTSRHSGFGIGLGFGF
jgi:hypothetical protein